MNQKFITQTSQTQSADGELYTWIGLEPALTETEIRTQLQKIYPTKKIHTDEELLALPDDQPWKNRSDIVFSLREPKSEFLSYISLIDYSHHASEHASVTIHLAQHLSVALSCRTICDGSFVQDHGEPFIYNSLIFENGICFLADDSNTDFADGSGGPVRLVRRLPQYDYKPDTAHS